MNAAAALRSLLRAAPLASVFDAGRSWEDALDEPWEPFLRDDPHPWPEVAAALVPTAPSLASV